MQQYKVSFLIAAPTFLEIYRKQCSAASFSSIRHVIAGAEKLHENLAQNFETLFGLRIMEGYGCSEAGPIIAVNSPIKSKGSTEMPGAKSGSVGRPLPDILVQIVNIDTFLQNEPGIPGLIHINSIPQFFVLDGEKKIWLTMQEISRTTETALVFA